MTLSDRKGFLHVLDGLSSEDMETLRSIEGRRGSVAELAERSGFEYQDGRPWHVSCDAAFSCATQNELDEKEDDAARSITRRVPRAQGSRAWRQRCSDSDS